MASKVIIGVESSLKPGGRHDHQALLLKVGDLTATDGSGAFGSGRLERLVTLLPVARAELVRLQRVQHAKHFLRVTTYAEVRDVDEADHTLGIDDVGRTLRDTGLRVENAEAGRQLALDVGEHRERQVLQLILRAPPRQVHELAVDAHTVDLRVTRLELLVELAERRNLGGANEREILGPEEHDLPLAGMAVLGERLKRLLHVIRHDAREGKIRKTLTNT